jgi:hypothetical protein
MSFKVVNWDSISNNGSNENAIVVGINPHGFIYAYSDNGRVYYCSFTEAERLGWTVVKPEKSLREKLATRSAGLWTWEDMAIIAREHFANGGK